MSEHHKPVPVYIKFLFGGLSGMMATSCIQPLDLLKTRMQMRTQGGVTAEQQTSAKLLFSIIKNEGFFTLYTGLTAALLRQATYTTGRLGIYTWLFDFISDDGKNPPNFAIKGILGMVAGASGAFMGTPADVALVRMTADTRLPKEQRRNYRNVFEALGRMRKEEGITTWWKGCVPTMGRAMVVNATQLATYSQAKQFLLSGGYLQDGLNLQFWASMISGLATSLASMPVDIAKTRIQDRQKLEGLKQPGLIKVIREIIKNEGVAALWTGFTPYYLRSGPHTVLTFIVLERFNVLYQKYR